MPAWLDTQKIGPKQILTVALAVVLLAGWYFGIGSSAPSQRSMERFIDYGLGTGAEGIGGFRDDGSVTQITKQSFSRIESATCHRNNEGRRLFKRPKGGFPRYDCLYSMLGSAGERYLTALSAIYMRQDTYKLTHVDHYSLMFWATEPDQRRLFALYGAELPKPATDGGTGDI